MDGSNNGASPQPLRTSSFDKQTNYQNDESIVLDAETQWAVYCHEEVDLILHSLTYGYLHPEKQSQSASQTSSQTPPQLSPPLLQTSHSCTWQPEVGMVFEDFDDLK